MQLGNLKAKGDGEFVSVPESARETPERLPEREPLKTKAKAREYPDFDYKYDLRREKRVEPRQPPPSIDLNEIENMVPPRRTMDEEAKEKLLFPPTGDEQKPSRDFAAAAASKKHRQMADKKASPPVSNIQSEVRKPYVRRRNSINGVEVKSREVMTTIVIFILISCPNCSSFRLHFHFNFHLVMYSKCNPQMTLLGF